MLLVVVVLISAALALATTTGGASTCAVSKHSDPEEADEERQSRVSLLQTRLSQGRVRRAAGGRASFAASGTSASLPPSLQKHKSPLPNKTITPVYWLHIPKTGTSFVNTLVSNKEICPYWLAVAERINTTAGTMDADGAFTAEGLMTLRSDDVQSALNYACPHGFAWFEAWGPFAIAQHYPLGDIWDALIRIAAYSVVMMRQPEQRLLSEYTSQDSEEGGGPGHQSLTDYIKFSEGCQTRYFTRGLQDFDSERLPDKASHVHCGGKVPLVNRKEVDVAKSRLQELAFVGITDQWDLSMCLWNAMFNQPCSAAQFYNLHPTDSKESNLYDTSVLDGYTDPYDGALFTEALLIFNDNLIRYNVTEGTCKQECATALAAG